MKQAVESIKNQIKSDVSESCEIRKRIHASSSMDRWSLWNEKRWLGSGTRAKLLAYACLRGRPYASVEAKCALGNEPCPSAILAVLESSWLEGAPERAEWTKDRVKAWLARPAASEAKEEAA